LNSSPVSLTFDDALHQHLDYAIPVLNESDLKGTFYAHLSAPALSSRLQEWMDAATEGHELGNHTIFHPATEVKNWVRPGNAIEQYSQDRMRLELETANQWLTAIDGKLSRSFAYPCSFTEVGDPGWMSKLIRKNGFQNTRLPGLIKKLGLDFGSTQQSYQSTVADLFVAGRAGGLLMNDEIPAIEKWNRWALYSVAVESHSFNEVRGFIERGLGSNRWPIIQFHGIAGGHHMDCCLQVFRDLVHWLADSNRDQVKTICEVVSEEWGRGD